MLNKDMNKRLKPVKGEGNVGKVKDAKVNSEISKDCPSCNNPRHDKTARKS